MTTSTDPRSKFIAALRFRALTGFYDWVVRATLREDALKAALVAQAGIAPGNRVLDLGCGTGTLTLMLKKAQPDAEIVGFDADEQALAIARKKAGAARVSIDFRRGLAEQLESDVGDEKFDIVVSSLFFHHLAWDTKLAVLRCVRRVLRADGMLHVADWGAPKGFAPRAGFLGIQVLDGFETTRDHASGRFEAAFAEAGFRQVERRLAANTAFGTMTYWAASDSRAVRHA